MKIFHLIESGGLYGAESVILNLSREMVAGNVYTPVVGCIVRSREEKSDLYDKALEYGLAAEKIVIRNSCLLVDIPGAARQLKRHKVSLIHSHGYKPSVFGALIRLITGIPIMATCHLWFLQGSVPLKMRLMVRLELFFYKFFPVVVAVSDPIKKTLVTHGVVPDTIKVIKNGIVLDDYSEMDRKNAKLLRSELGVRQGELCILNIARLSRQKAQWHIVTAAEKMVDLGYPVKFFIVGEGPLRQELESQIKQSGVEETVRLLGFRRDVKELLQVADIFLLPSLDEGMPMALLEAVASRVPAVVTAVGDIPKIIRSGYSGMVVNTDDAEDLLRGLKEVVDSAKLRQKMSANAIKIVSQSYSSEVMYRQYADVYRTFLC